jgi:hypothetical protein
MNKLLKKITAYSLIVIVGSAAILTLLHSFGSVKGVNFWIYFGSRREGGASNTPIFFGLILIGACYLLANSDKD